ncbi:sugar ABC transporter permease [Longivirga aurantiaca]|uniref:Xylose transport system permease protein XylH n=1 Tax=Longivirga aurantiaca TaxID=1837743 RepID=A0ABW1T1V7_9ACTN
MSETSLTQKELENAAEVPDNGLSAAAREYVARVRGGDVGPLPAILGLVVLLLVFSALRPTTFTNPFNFANLIVQSAAIIVIAMGLVFVLLLGEIDLSAGFTAGVCGAMLGIVTTRWGMSWIVGVLVCLAVGAVIGLVIGTLVSRIGIPSFVVTLAMFLALQGALLGLIGEGGTIRISSPVILAIMANTLPPWLGWVLFVVCMAAYAFFTYRAMAVRRAKGLVAQSTSVWAVKVGCLGLLLGLCVFYLNLERSRNSALSSIKGIPIVVVLLLVLLVALTFLLLRTAFGRHLYAIGGNAEAARRAGINVPLLRTLAFVLCSTIAGIAGIVLASRVNSVTPSTGGGETLLFAVAAAVIGGTSLFGGKGRPADAIIGGLVIAVVGNGMGLLNQPAAVVYIVTGFVLLLAAGVDALSRRRSAATGRG